MHTDPAMTWAALVPLFAIFVIPVVIGVVALLCGAFAEVLK